MPKKRINRVAEVPTVDFAAMLNSPIDPAKTRILRLYHRIKVLNECFEHPAFMEWCSQNLHTSDIRFLDKEVEDTALDFMTLRAVYREYPDERFWARYSIREMMAGCMAKQKEERRREKLRETIAGNPLGSLTVAGPSAQMQKDSKELADIEGAWKEVVDRELGDCEVDRDEAERLAEEKYPGLKRDLIAAKKEWNSKHGLRVG